MEILKRKWILGIVTITISTIVILNVIVFMVPIDNATEEEENQRQLPQFYYTPPPIAEEVSQEGDDRGNRDIGRQHIQQGEQARWAFGPHDLSCPGKARRC
jgi:hypothetical protein